MSNQSSTPKAAQSDAPLTINQFFKLVQTQLMLWRGSEDAAPGVQEGIDHVYPQASGLAEQFDSAFAQQPGKFIAQLHQFKPHFEPLTNLTVKAMIFTAIMVRQQQWSILPRISLIAATLTANIANLTELSNALSKELNDPNAKKALNDTEQTRLDKGAAYSHKLLSEAKVLDPLWLHSISNSASATHTKRHPLGLEGAIVRCANQFGRSLCSKECGKEQNPKLTIGGALSHLYLNDNHIHTEHIINQSAQNLPMLCEGSLVMLKNKQLALVMHLMSDNTQLVFLFPEQKLSIKGRFVVIGHKHIAYLLPCYVCEEPKLYSFLWQSPLHKMAQEKEINLLPSNQPPNQEQPDSDIFTPPPNLADLLTDLFAQPSLGKIAEQISQSEALSQLLTKTASEVASDSIQITDTKHAIAMLGLNRLGPLLTQGALLSIMLNHHFPGDALVANRQHCFIQAVKYYAQFSDLMMVEEITLCALFWFAPLIVSKEIQVSACRLYRQKTMATEDIFDITSLFGLQLTDSHKQQVMTLAKSWQLPKVSLEIFRQLNKPDSSIRPAKKVEQALAVIRLATLHSHSIFNQLDIQSAHVQKLLQQNLTILDIALNQYAGHQQSFLLGYAPYTPL